MGGDFGDRSPEKSSVAQKKITNENWTEFRWALEAAGQQVLENVGAKIESHKLLVLVDLQGMYLGLHEWLSEKGFPIEGGLVLSRIAFFQILDTFHRIKIAALKSSDGCALDFESLLDQIEQVGSGGSIKVSPEARYLRVVPQFELFYAPAPLGEIEWRLRQKAKSRSIEAQNQLNLIQTGVLKHKYFTRNYEVYADFVAKLKANPEYSRSEEGFFNYYVGPNGLQVFDEKEVDTRIVIRAMDALYNYEADSLCIVSSDQDFMPVHLRAGEFGVQSYQADLAKFRGDGVGRKIKDLGTGFISGRIDPVWPLTIITEAVSSPDLDHHAQYALSESEFNALCKLHNEMNEYHVSLEFLSDGEVKIIISKPE